MSVHQIRSDTELQFGDSVEIYVTGDAIVRGIIIGTPNKIDQAWKILTGNTVYDLVYVQQYQSMKRIPNIESIAWRHPDGKKR